MRMNDDLDCVIDAETQDALRAGTWTLLGRLLLEPPGDEVRRRLAAIDASAIDTSLIDASAHGADALAAAWAQLGAALRGAADAVVRREFQDVFVGVGGGELTPYASWYIAGALYDRPLVRLREDLEALGVARRGDCNEPEDHAAAICEIMAFALLDQDVDFGWQQELFRRHVDSWMGRFFEDLQQAPGAAFYRAVGAFGQAFLEVERRFYAMSA